MPWPEQRQRHALAPRPCTSLRLTDTPHRRQPDVRLPDVVAAEKRPLKVYTRLTGGSHEERTAVWSDSPREAL